MGRKSASESEDGVVSANSPLSCNEGDSVGGRSSGIILKKGPWTSAEDAVLMEYVKKNGEGNWNAVQKHAGLARCGKSCRLRWANHLRPNLKKGAFTLEEERLIIELHANMGNKWAKMAAHLPGRTDNEIKNYWNTRIKRRQRAGLPLYPPSLYLPTQRNIQQPLSLCTRDFGCHDDILLQIDDHKKSDVVSGGFNIFPETPEYGISPSIATDNCFLSQSYTIAQGPDEPLLDHESGDARKPLGSYQDTQFVSSIFPSAPKHLIDAQKPELPSLQYQETSLCFWDLKSKPSDTAPHHSTVSGALSCNRPFSAGSSGLLEDLIYGAKSLSKSEAHSAPGSVTDDSTIKECVAGKSHYHPIAPSDDNSAGPDSNGRATTSAAGGSLEDIILHHLKSEILDETWMLIDDMKNAMHGVDCSRPETLLESGWDFRSSLLPPQNATVDDSIAAHDSKTHSSTSGLGSCSWNNMPAPCQISETP